jgi:hypothetical protein
MKPQVDNIVMSNMLLWLDNQILSKGEAFTNYSGNFYPVDSLVNGFYTYSLPFKQIVADASISGANLMSGIYLNDTYINPGTSGFSGINPNVGYAFFSSDPAGSGISGNYAVKDFNIYLTSLAEEQLIFETKFEINPKVTQNPTGISTSALTYPAIFLKNNGGQNKPFALGGQDETLLQVRAIVMADNLFSLDAVCSILRDTARKNMPLISQSNMPFDNYGITKNNNFNYINLVSGIVNPNLIYVKTVNVSKIIPYRYEYQNNVNPEIFSAFVDFELSDFRYPHA